MHIPDGFLDIKTVVGTNIISITSILLALKKIKGHISPEKIPVMGIMTAFLFTLQLIAFPMIGGTSVHLMGVVFSCAVLGPFTTLITMSVSLFIQALLFQHGGIFTFGANFLNIALVSVLYYLFFNLFFKSTNIIVICASFLGVINSAFLCALELGISQRINIKTSLLSIMIAHIPIAIIESAASVFLLNILKKIKPDILDIKKL